MHTESARGVSKNIYHPINHQQILSFNLYLTTARAPITLIELLLAILAISRHFYKNTTPYTMRTSSSLHKWVLALEKAFIVNRRVT